MPDVTVDNHIKKDTIVKPVNTRKDINLNIILNTYPASFPYIAQLFSMEHLTHKKKC